MKRLVSVSTSLIVLAGAASATVEPAERSRNLRQLARVPFSYGEKELNAAGMAFDGRRLVVTTDETSPTRGFGIFEVMRRHPHLRQTGFVRCPHGLETISLWGNYLLQSVDRIPPQPTQDPNDYDEAIERYQTPSKRCDGPGATEPKEGIRILDISNPGRARFVKFLPTPGGSSGHAVARFGRKVYIYEANDLSPEAPPEDQTKTFEIRVFRFFPRRPERTYLASHAPLGVNGCQNITIFVPRRLAACTGLNVLALFDLSDPVNPQTLYTDTPEESSYLMKTNFTWDGRYLLLGKVGDGPCSPNDGPNNDLVILDVEDPTNPVEAGRFSLPRATQPTVRDEIVGAPAALQNVCSPYSVQVLPMRQRRRYAVVLGHVAGGVSVVDFTDVAKPREIGFHAAAKPEPTHIPFAYWYQGRIYGGEDYSGGGIRVLRMKGLGRSHVRSYRRRLIPNVQIPSFR